MNEYEKKYNYVLKRAKVLKECSLSPRIKDWVDSVFPELKESEDEKMRKDCIKYLDWEYQHCPIDEDKMKIEKCIAWLEKQGNKTEEYIFRPIAGCSIDEAARQAIDKATNGENIVFSFNGFYIKIYNDTTIDNIINSYNDFCKKQSKPKWTEEDEENFRDIIGAIHSVAYQTTEDEEARINWIKSLKQRIDKQQ